MPYTGITSSPNSKPLFAHQTKLSHQVPRAFSQVASATCNAITDLLCPVRFLLSPLTVQELKWRAISETGSQRVGLAHKELHFSLEGHFLMLLLNLSPHLPGNSLQPKVQPHHHHQAPVVSLELPVCLTQPRFLVNVNCIKRGATVGQSMLLSKLPHSATTQHI